MSSQRKFTFAISSPDEFLVFNFINIFLAKFLMWPRLLDVLGGRSPKWFQSFGSDCWHHDQNCAASVTPYNCSATASIIIIIIQWQTCTYCWQKSTGKWQVDHVYWSLSVDLRRFSRVDHTLSDRLRGLFSPISSDQSTRSFQIYWVFIIIGHVLFLYFVFYVYIHFLPRCMECRRGLAMSLSVRPSNAWIVTKWKKDV